MGDQDKKWAPHICCVTCSRLLTGWANGSRHMSFAVPMVWREPTDHTSNCYFCLTNTTGITNKSKHSLKYPNLPSAIRPVPHSQELPIPNPPESVEIEENVSFAEELEEKDEAQDPSFELSPEPHLLTQGDLNDLVRDLNLSKKQAELLGSRLK